MNNKKLFVVSSVGRSPLSICLCLLAVSAVTTALSSSAQFSIGPNLTSDRISYANNVSQVPYDLGEPAWLFGSSQNPISISDNSAAGIWQRRVSGDGAFSHNQEMDRVDYVKVGAGSPWTDWHETIATPNFVWSNDADDTFYTINGGAPQYTGISYSPDRTTVNIALPTDLPVGARSSCTTKRNTWVPHVSTITPFRLCSINSPMFLSLPGCARPRSGAGLGSLPPQITILSLVLGRCSRHAGTMGRQRPPSARCPLLNAAVAGVLSVATIIFKIIRNLLPLRFQRARN